MQLNPYEASHAIADEKDKVSTLQPVRVIYYAHVVGMIGCAVVALEHIGGMPKPLQGYIPTIVGNVLMSTILVCPTAILFVLSRLRGRSFSVKLNIMTGDLAISLAQGIFLWLMWML